MDYIPTNFDMSSGHACIAVYPGMIRAKIPGGSVSNPPQDPEPSTRGNIVEFSAKSRKRLIELVLSFRFPPTAFITLTYPRSFPAASETKKHLNHFLTRVGQKFPESYFVWKMEPQKRGAPHFHLLGTFGPADTLPSKELLNKWISQVWYDVVGSDDPRHLLAGTNFKELPPDESGRLIGIYLSKYFSKTITTDFAETWKFPGRMWGLFQKKNAPIVTQPLLLEIPVNDFHRLKRLVIKYLKSRLHYAKKTDLPARRRSHKRISKYLKQAFSLTAYIPEKVLFGLCHHLYGEIPVYEPPLIQGV